MSVYQMSALKAYFLSETSKEKKKTWNHYFKNQKLGVHFQNVFGKEGVMQMNMLAAFLNSLN